MALFLFCSVRRFPTIRAFVVSPAAITRSRRPTTTSFRPLASTIRSSSSSSSEELKLIDLHTIPKPELESILQSWGYPKYRADQVWAWIHDRGVMEVEDMNNLPQTLRQDLEKYSRIGTLELDTELISEKDGTRKRAYRLHDGQVIESVLMPYDDGRYTACISSQAGCAMGCVFCATGQMGFARQLTPEEILEQVSRFRTELAAENKRLSNIVFMGMGEPLANYRNVKTAIRRITQEMGIGARKITISTVGIVPMIRKMMDDPELPQVRLAVSLHTSNDAERSALLPANRRYGGLSELMNVLSEYIEKTNRRITLEWALIEGKNDTPEIAAQLGRLIRSTLPRKDMVHINVIPLNPTGGFGGSPSGRRRVDAFCKQMEVEFGVACTPRVRRGIDIDAGCGQLKAKVQKKEEQEKQQLQENVIQEKQLLEAERDLKSFMAEQVSSPGPPLVGVYEEQNEEEDGQDSEEMNVAKASEDCKEIDVAEDEEADESQAFSSAQDFDNPNFINPEWKKGTREMTEAERLIALVEAQFDAPPGQAEYTSTPPTANPSSKKNKSRTTTSIVDNDAVVKAKRRKKKLLKLLRSIEHLREIESLGIELNEEQLSKIGKEEEWRAELESVTHNLK